MSRRQSRNLLYDYESVFFIIIDQFREEESDSRIEPLGNHKSRASQKTGKKKRGGAGGKKERISWSVRDYVSI